MTTHKPRGFAAIAPDRAREIRRLGGLAVSRDRDRMRAIGAMGGKARAEDYRSRKRGDDK